MTTAHMQHTALLSYTMPMHVPDASVVDQYVQPPRRRDGREALGHGGWVRHVTLQTDFDV